MTKGKKGASKGPPFKGNRCQAELDAVNAAQSALQGLQLRVQSLQSELQNATPQEKSGIVAEMRDLTENQIPWAKAKLDSAEAALKKCQHSFGILTTPSPPPARQ